MARGHGGENNGIGRLDPKTGDMNIWRFSKKGGFHDILLDKEEKNVWVVGEVGFVKFDIMRHGFTSWNIPKKYGTGGHTHDLDPDGNVWSTMSGGHWVVKLDPRNPYERNSDRPESIWASDRPEGYGVVYITLRKQSGKDRPQDRQDHRIRPTYPGFRYASSSG